MKVILKFQSVTVNTNKSQIANVRRKQNMWEIKSTDGK